MLGVAGIGGVDGLRLLFVTRVIITYTRRMIRLEIEPVILNGGCRIKGYGGYQGWLEGEGGGTVSRLVCSGKYDRP